MGDEGSPGGRRRARTISRRMFLSGTAAALGGVALAGCSGAGSGGGREVRFWNLFAGGDGARLSEMQGTFVEENPGIELSATTLAWGGPYYTKLSMATVGGRPPEVGVLHQSRLPAYAPADLLEPLDPRTLSEYGIGPDKFLPEVLDGVRYEGEIFAIPLDTHPFVVFYNTDVCEKAGLLDSDGNLKETRGPDAFTEAFRAAMEVTGAQGVSLGVTDAATSWRLFSTLYGQQGGEVLASGGSEIVLDDEKAARAIDFMRELTLGAKVVPASQDYAGAVAEFQNANAGFHLNGEWEVTTFEEAEMPFSMARFPDVFGTRRAFGDRHAFVVPKGIAGDEQAMDGALRFISSMMRNSFIWAQGGHIPAFRPVLESERYTSLTPQSNYAGVATEIVPYPDAWFSGAGSSLETVSTPFLIDAMSGRVDAEGAISGMRGALQTLVDTPRPVPE